MAADGAHLGGRIQAERMARGWTQPDLVGRVNEMYPECGLTQQALDRLEKRNSKRSSAASYIADALGLSTRWLISGEGPKHDARVGESAAQFNVTSGAQLEARGAAQATASASLTTVPKAKREMMARLVAQWAADGDPAFLEAFFDLVAKPPPSVKSLQERVDARARHSSPGEAFQKHWAAVLATLGNDKWVADNGSDEVVRLAKEAYALAQARTMSDMKVAGAASRVVAQANLDALLADTAAPDPTPSEIKRSAAQR